MTTTPHPEDMPEAIKAYEDRYQCSAEDPMCQADLGFFLAGWSASASLAEQRTRAMREALEQALEFIADHEDVRDGDAGPLPNRAMVLATELRASLSTPPSAPGNGEAEGKDAWISVKDRMPKRNRRVLAYFPKESTSVMDGIWDGERFMVNGFDRTHVVTHWHELPSAPAQSGGQGK